MNLNILIPLIYLFTSFACFYLGWRGIKSGEIIFKKGIKGTSLEKNDLFRRMQIFGVFFLGVILLGYAAFSLGL